MLVLSTKKMKLKKSKNDTKKQCWMEKVLGWSNGERMKMQNKNE